MLYTYTSAAATNGSAFTGSYANTPFYNLTLALAMLCGRFLVIIPVLAIAGSFAAKKNGPGLGRHLSNRWDAIRLSTRRHRIDCRCSHLHPGARARSARRALFRVPAPLILPAGSQCSHRRFKRVSNLPFISRLLHGGLFRLEFICRNGHVIGTVPGPSNGFEAPTTDPERADDMAQIQAKESQESCEPPLRPLSRSLLLFIGTDSRG